MRKLYLIICSGFFSLFLNTGCQMQDDNSDEIAKAEAMFKQERPLGIIGEVEVVHIPGFEEPFEARIDTGASTSSIDARGMSLFDRDGKKWVVFTMYSPNKKQSQRMEYPVVRLVKIKSHAGEPLERPVINLTFRIGHLTLTREFTLADRNQFEYPVLIGRNILSGLAAVDPAIRNTL